MTTSHPLFLLFVLHSAVLVAAQSYRASKNTTSPWQTLHGNAPLVIAKGGFSGIFPDSSIDAYESTLLLLSNVILWCDVQLTKDGAGICFPYLNLDNSSDITFYIPNDSKNNRIYYVNGQPMQGHFSVDFTLNDLKNFFRYAEIRDWSC
uniref:glycerophosphodiester phosphodiesterase n=1 Tax=Nelumbo nucifera TaxID=4432 RepID=A0A822XFZ1_NELNU|nr:TPA_asm: hypothetical protein HUJ06_019208 [Nelumbo nucifera]